jgi:hypothetical protein
MPLRLQAPEQAILECGTENQVDALKKKDPFK